MVKYKFVYTRCSRGNGMTANELGEILGAAKKVTLLYLSNYLVSRKTVYQVLGLDYHHKDSIVYNKMITYFRSKLNGEKVFIIKNSGITYLFERKK